MDKKIIQKVKENCIGYYHDWESNDTWSFGNSDDKSMIPLGAIQRVLPITRLTAYLNNLPHYIDHIRRNTTTTEKAEREDELQKETIFVYHIPLDVDQLVDHFEDIPMFSGQEYEPRKQIHSDPSNLIDMRFDNPYFVHHRKGNGPGAPAEFFVVGERENTSSLVEVIDFSSRKVGEAIIELTGADSKYVWNNYGEQNTFTLYDKTRKPRKHVMNIPRRMTA